MKITLTILTYLIMALSKYKPDDIKLSEINVYPTTACVTIVSYNKSEKGYPVIVSTFTDIKYVFFTDEPDEWLPGDIVALTMSDNGTEDVLDDVIIEERYTGWVEQWAFNIKTNDYMYKFSFD